MTVSAAPTEKRPTVLIVDDSPLEAQQAARALASWFDVEVLQDGHSTIERLTTHALPDALVLDWVLPDLSGVDLCRFLRTTVSTESLPVLMISSRSEAQDVIEGFAAGADDYLAKPFDGSELLARVSSLIRARQLLGRAESAERALLATLEYLPDAVLGVDPAGSIVLVNAETTRTFGVPARQLLHRPVSEVMPGLRQTRHGVTLVNQELKLAERCYSVHMRPLPSESVAATIIVLHDVTAERNAAAQAREEAQRKDEFLAMLGHELRNPLAAIASASQLLKVAGTDPRIAQRAHSVLGRQISHMVRLVDDLLDVSRITRGRIELRKERIDVRLALQRAVESVSAFVQAHRHHLEVSITHEPACIDADPTRIEQVFSNLLTNAAKYTPDGGHIRVSLTTAGNNAVISIRDNGIGIPPDAMANVFDLFTQIDRTLDRSQGGLGIGLTVVRGIVDLHGGQVQAFSEGVGLGSEFRVTLPLDAPMPIPARDSSEEAPVRPPSHSIATVLVVDDHQDNADLLSELLRSAGYRVTCAHAAREALDLATREPTDAVILDIGLPDIDGYELAARLRAMPSMARARLIALTGYGQANDVARSVAAGIDMHLVKPASREALFEALGGSS